MNRLLLLTTLLFLASPVLANDIWVTDLDDDTNENNGTCNLREALKAAETNATVDQCAAGSDSESDTVYFAKTGRIELIQTLPTIRETINILGPGSDLLTIDANGFGAALTFAREEDCTLSGMTITGGMGSGIRQSISGDGGLLTIRDAVITENQGSGLSVKNLTLIRSTVSDNTTSGSGGGINIFSGVINIFDSTISGNSAESQGGGANFSSSEVVIRRSTFSDNTSNGNGGAISAGGSRSLDIAHSTITNNTAGAGLIDGSGGGVRVTASSTAIFENTIIAGNFDLTPSEFGPDIDFSEFSTIQSHGYNLIGEQGYSANGFNVGNPNILNDYVGTTASPLVANLLPLAPVFSPTASHRPDLDAAINTVIDKGSCSLESYDQRGKSGITVATLRRRDKGNYANADDGCDIGAHEEGAFAKLPEYNIKVLLDGPYTNVLMNTELNQAGQVPLNHPYNTPPWNYSGFGQMNSITVDMVDWILFELYQGGPEDPGGMTLAAQTVFPLENNGTMFLADAFNWIHIPPGQYYVVIRHRNHLAVMSSVPVSVDWDGLVSYDFRTSLESAYSSGGAPMRDVGNGLFTMWGGDGNADGAVTAFDFVSKWLPINGNSDLYDGGDFNMDGTATAFDFLLIWLLSNGQASQAP